MRPIMMMTVIMAIMVLGNKLTNSVVSFYVRVTVYRNKFLCNKTKKCTNSTNLFFHETLHVSDSSSVHRQEFIHCRLINGICHTGL